MLIPHLFENVENRDDVVVADEEGCAHYGKTMEEFEEIFDLVVDDIEPVLLIEFEIFSHIQSYSRVPFDVNLKGLLL